MTNNTLANFSQDLAQLVGAAAPSVVQVHGHRRPASGVVIGENAVLTTVRALAREEGVTVRTDDGNVADAELAGWDPPTGLAVLRVGSLNIAPARPAAETARVGQLGIALARSWSNAITATIGLVSVLGGPLRTGRRSSIEQVLRTSAPMHEGFAGGAFLDVTGAVIGINTAASIRGLQVVIPASIAWHAASQVLEHGRPRRGFVGVAGQAVTLAGRQRDAVGRETGMLIVNVTSGAPADQGGVLTGDVLVEYDGKPIASADDLVDLLRAESIGRSVAVKVLRGAQVEQLSIVVVERTR